MGFTNINRSLAPLLLLSLAACGGGGGSSVPTTPPVATPPPAPAPPPAPNAVGLTAVLPNINRFYTPGSASPPLDFLL